MALRRFWHAYALVAFALTLFFAHLVFGPGGDAPFARNKAVDFGAFYSGATIVWQGDGRDVGNISVQRATQARIQAREATGWNWYNSLPHPPVVSLLDAPLAALSLRTAFWVWTALGLAAAITAVWLLASTFCQPIAVAAAVILLGFEPIWDVAWWGQLDSFILLPVAAGCVLLIRRPTPRRDFAAGLLLGALALKPIFVPIPLVALAWGRRRAVYGMIVTSLTLAGISVAMVGRQGMSDYVSLARRYQQFTGAPFVVEWRMYNLRGMAIRLGLGADNSTRFWLVLVTSVVLGLLTAILAGRALAANHSPDLAISALMLGMFLTAYHTHVQSLVFATIPLAVALGRSLRARTWHGAGAWAAVFLAIHSGAALLRPARPAPPNATSLETFLTSCFLVLLVVLILLLLRPLPTSQFRHAERTRSI